MKSCMVIGLGRFGLEAALTLRDLGCEVLAVDLSGEAAGRAAARGLRTVEADARDKEVLQTLGVHNYDCAVVAAGEDLGTAVLIVLNLQELGIPQLICRAENDAAARALVKLGADRVILPEQDAGAWLARHLAAPGILEELGRADSCAVLERPVPRSWVGLNLRQLELRSRQNVSVVAVNHQGQTLTASLADYQLCDGDALLLTGWAEDLKAVEAL